MPTRGTHQVAVIGAGPAGLLAAHAVERMGHEPVIISPRKESNISPVQCLWSLPPGLFADQYELYVTKTGNERGYAKRLYGDPEAQTSWPRINSGTHFVYPLKPVYEHLWLSYESEIMNIELTTGDIPEVLRNYALVLCSAPAYFLCRNQEEHVFLAVRTQVVTKQLAGETTLKIMALNGGSEPDSDDDNWFRWTQINGVDVTEYADGVERDGAVGGVKPISTDCDCWQSVGTAGGRPRQLHRIGRFGLWQQGVQTHQAFEAAVSIMSTEGIGRSV